MKLEHFMSLWAFLVATTLIVTLAQSSITFKSQQLREAVETNHFSVVWKGFSPSYSNETEDYYICVNNLQDNELRMHIALQIQNFENNSYYFMIDQYTTPPTGWNVTAGYLGKVEIDQTISCTYSNITREKPSTITEGILDEDVQLVVKAFWEDTYTTLYSQDNFTVRFHFIDISSTAWTQVYYDNFDDGTLQGWTAYGEVQWYTKWRSWPCSLLGIEEFSKTYDTTGSYSEMYMVFAIYPTVTPSDGFKVYINGTQHFGSDESPHDNTWYQIAIPLPLDSTVEITIDACGPWNLIYLDDVFVVAK